MPYPRPPDDHVELTVQRMAELHADHEERATPLQRGVARLTASLARPRSLALALAIIVLWLLANTVGPRLGSRAFDAAPFNLLELTATLAALITTLMILVTQAREEEAARHRSQLTLQLASLSEQKIAKVIELLEEQRRDSPHMASRSDVEAEEMSKPADPRRVLDRIRDTHEGGEA